MKVKSILKINTTSKIKVFESFLNDNNDEILTDHSIDLINYKGVKKITDNWIEYSHWVLLPQSVREKEVDMISTEHTGTLVIYTKPTQCKEN